MADIVTRVRNAVGDITEAEAQAFVLDAARELAAESRWDEDVVSLGTTVADQGEYDLTDTIVDFYSVLVDGVPYVQATAKDIEEIDAGVSTLHLGSPIPQGVYAPYPHATGDLKLSIRPTPDEAGLAITGRVILTITVSNWSTDNPPWPADFDQVCIAGAVALGLDENDDRADLAATHRAKFEAGIKRLRSRKSSRVGKGAIQLPAPRRMR